MFRALRLDKLIYQALETTLRNLLLERWDRIPALAMIASVGRGVARAGEKICRPVWRGFVREIVEGSSVVGGGATPQRELASWVIAVECGDVVEVERRLPGGDPAVVARIEDGRLMVDLRNGLCRRRGSIWWRAEFGRG